jgi:hypothetical protein
MEEKKLDEIFIYNKDDITPRLGYSYTVLDENTV